MILIKDLLDALIRVILILGSWISITRHDWDWISSDPMMSSDEQKAAFLIIIGIVTQTKLLRSEENDHIEQKGHFEFLKQIIRLSTLEVFARQSRTTKKLRSNLGEVLLKRRVIGTMKNHF